MPQGLPYLIDIVQLADAICRGKGLPLRSFIGRIYTHGTGLMRET